MTPNFQHLKHTHKKRNNSAVNRYLLSKSIVTERRSQMRKLSIGNSKYVQSKMLSKQFLIKFCNIRGLIAK